eukprot:5840770-Pyramimonas_sp.AAC.1
MDLKRCLNLKAVRRTSMIGPSSFPPSSSVSISTMGALPFASGKRGAFPSSKRTRFAFLASSASFSTDATAASVA